MSLILVFFLIEVPFPKKNIFEGVVPDQGSRTNKNRIRFFLFSSQWGMNDGRPARLLLCSFNYLWPNGVRAFTPACSVLSTFDLCPVRPPPPSLFSTPPLFFPTTLFHLALEFEISVRSLQATSNPKLRWEFFAVPGKTLHSRRASVRSHVQLNRFPLSQSLSVFLFLLVCLRSSVQCSCTWSVRVCFSPSKILLGWYWSHQPWHRAHPNFATTLVNRWHFEQAPPSNCIHQSRLEAQICQD